MARMSLPQMPEAFILISTCPGPGTGTCCVLKVTVELPGNTAPAGGARLYLPRCQGELELCNDHDTASTFHGACPNVHPGKAGSSRDLQHTQNAWLACGVWQLLDQSHQL